MSTLKATYLQQASSASPNITLDASTNATVAGTLAMGSSFKRNRIINGNMLVNQRATAVSGSPSAYTVDRWLFAKSNDATESVAQNTDAPTGFSYSLRNTISVADTSIGATQYSTVYQPIEGYNISDFSFGTANAKTVTLSFWVKATQTGTYSAVIQGGSPLRQAFKAFSVSASNTWEYKTLTFVGDTDTGSTWNSTNGLGLSAQFYFALGSTFINGTDGTWAASSTNNYGPSGMANGLSANGNICAITGVQLETGSIATPYERQIYSDQLAQCQRYCLIDTNGGAAYRHFGTGYATSGTSGNIDRYFPVTMRTAPAITFSAQNTFLMDGDTSSTTTVLTDSGFSSVSAARITVTVASGMTAGKAYSLGSDGSSSTRSITYSAEL